MIYIYISSGILLVFFIVMLVAGKKSRHYTGDKPLDERLKKHGITLVGNTLEFNGTTYIISEYWQLYESEGRKAVFTRFEYYYKAPLLRYFHVAKRPREEIINHAHSSAVDVLVTNDASFDSYYMVRSQTGEESLALLTPSVISFMIKCAQNEEEEIELFDNFVRFTIPGKPEYVATDIFMDVLLRFDDFARNFETARIKQPLPPQLKSIYDAICNAVGECRIEKSDEGGCDLPRALPSGRTVYFTLRAGSDGIHIRIPLVKQSECIFVFSETSFPMQYSTEKYDIRLFTPDAGSNFLKKLKILQISPKEGTTGNSRMKKFVAGKKRRMYQLYFQRMKEALLFDLIEKTSAELEKMASKWSKDRLPSLELSTQNLRVYLPGPVNERVPLGNIIVLLDTLAGEFLHVHNSSSENICS
ncbi:MAG: hypothetical protein JXR95_07810 [Deltaproteobacteria bacterium]|nr:hypothetical protein [Deltaproteobacteria bacterium]